MNNLMRPLFALFLCLLLSGLVSAQENQNSPYNFALALIAEAQETQAKELQLSDLDLTELPPEIGNLTNLEVLVLANNSLRSLPVEISNLTKLRQLTLSDNLFT